MRFEVKDKEGRVMMWTSDVCCIPNAAQLRALRAAGYKAYMDGRPVRTADAAPAPAGRTGGSND